jgi:hypothetical protein
MASANGIGFLGRVPIDTILVGLLDAVSKGELPAAALTGPADTDADEPVAEATKSISSSAEPNGSTTSNTQSSPVIGQNRPGEGETELDASATAATPANTKASTAPFPLLDRYLETTSSKVWREIATKVVEGIDARKADISTQLAATSIE